MTTLHLKAGEIAPSGERISIAVSLHLPARPSDARLLLLCVPGGGVSRGYFDLAGGDGDSFSFARAMTEHGHVVALIDPPGIGESSRPADGFLLTVDNEIRLLQGTIEQLRSRRVAEIDLARLLPIGVGHSAGAMLTGARQARYGGCAALVMLSFSTSGLPDQLSEEHRQALAAPDRGRARLVEFARTRFGGQAYIHMSERQAETPAARALAAVRDTIVAPIAVQAMSPGNIAPELALIDVPVICAAGDRDMVGPPHLIGNDYVACPDFTLFRVPQSGHHLFLSPNAGPLFARIADWLRTVVPPPERNSAEPAPRRGSTPRGRSPEESLNG